MGSLFGVSMSVDSRKSSAAWLSVGSNIFLIVIKLVAGFAIGSVSVISEAIHSAVDLVAAVIALFAVKHSGRPADARHAFGHGKVENMSGTIEAILIFGAAGWIIYEAIQKFSHLHEKLDVNWGVAVMFLSAAVNFVISARLMKVGKQTDSVALQADAWHLRTDVYTSAGVMVGLGMIWIGDAFLPQLGDALHVIDPIAAIVVAVLIVRAAYKLTLQSARDLLDAALPPGEEQWIIDSLKTFVPAMHGYHQMRTRKSGAQRFIDFHIFVDGKMTVQASHRLAHEISDRIKAHFPDSSVIVHVEPCNGDCQHCRAVCMLSAPQQDQIRQQHSS